MNNGNILPDGCAIFKRIQDAMPQDKEFSMIITEFRWRRGFWEQDLWDQLNAWEGA